MFVIDPFLTEAWIVALVQIVSGTALELGDVFAGELARRARACA